MPSEALHKVVGCSSKVDLSKFMQAKTMGQKYCQNGHDYATYSCFVVGRKGVCNFELWVREKSSTAVAGSSSLDIRFKVWHTNDFFSS